MCLVTQCRCSVLLLFLAASLAQQTLSPPPLSSITLPQGFQIALYTNSSLPNARQLTISQAPEGAPEGNIIYLGSTTGNVFPTLLPGTALARKPVVTGRPEAEDRSL